MKFNKTERSWLLYDVANSAFVLLISTTIPIYFRALAEADGIDGAVVSSYFATSTAVAVLILALISPIMGAIADFKGMKKKLFTVSLIIGLIGGFSLAITTSWQAFLFLFIVARIGYAACNVFYDSMLVDVTSDERMDTVSGAGYAFGYVGSTIPFVVGIVLVLFGENFGLSVGLATQISFAITMVWWAVLSIPLLKNVNQTYYKPSQPNIVRHSFKNLKVTMKKIYQDKKMFYFILAYFFYIDGVYTIISQSASFGGEVGIDSTQLILALLYTQFVAFPFAILSGWFAKRFAVLKVLKVYVLIYTMTAVMGFFLQHAWQFWVLATLVGMAQGGIQSLSRSYFGKLVPKDASNEYFGFFDIFGKFADFFGPLLMVLSVALFDTSRYGILGLVVLFGLGIFFLNKVEKLS